MKPSPKTKLAELEKAVESKSPPQSSKLCFAPGDVYYAADKATYIVDVGTHFREYQRKKPVMTGIMRHLKAEGNSDDDLKSIASDHLEDIELDRACDWVGSIAGHHRGITTIDHRKFLIMDEPAMIDPRRGEWPIIQSILDQAFPDRDARDVFQGWLKGGIGAIRNQSHSPAPMIVMAGEANAGKSLLAFIAKTILGGRSANPTTAWGGKLPWNDDILRAELLLIDDSVGSTDPRARKAFGAYFKEAIFSDGVTINTRRKSSITLRPAWRVMVCCNETAENLSVIPPLEDGIEDKVSLLKVSPIVTPMPASTAEEKTAFAAAIRDELPGFIHHLENFTIPAHLTDSRMGVTAWKDQELLNAVMEISPERRLENLIELAATKGHFPLASGESEWMSAAEVQSILEDRGSPTASQAQGLLKFHSACGRSLSALVKLGSRFVTDVRVLDGMNRYLITLPEVGEVG